MRHALYFVAVLAAARMTLASDAPEMPIGPVPEFGRAEVAADGSLEIATVVSKPVWETRTMEVPYSVTKVVNGQTVVENRVKTVTTQVCRWVSEMRMRRVPAGDCEVRQGNKKLSKAEYAGLLKKATPVVISKGPLPKFYHEFLKESVIVIEMAEKEEIVAPEIPDAAPPPVPPPPPRP